MKKFYFLLSFFTFSLFVSAQNSSEVGITEGQLSVSLSGAATYAIPISVPPGINGVVPQIGLAYNSQSGSGIAGYGWDISGVSSITRIASTTYHDGIIDAVDFDNLDRFALDGQRLIIKSGTTGTYGADHTLYETESFSNLKITSYGVNPNGANYGPAYFIIEYPDGSKAYYGNSSDSRSITDWSITYWENPQGIRISYNYSLTNNLLNITSIKYGSTGTLAPINEIKFNYANSNWPEQSYIGGQSLTKSKRLASINVIGNGVGFRNYVLDYNVNIFEKLEGITEKSGDNSKSYNPLVFYYDLGTDGIVTRQSNSSIGLGEVNSKNSATVSGDFDGDGKMDFVLYPTQGVNSYKDFWLFKNVGGGSSISPLKAACGNFNAIFSSKGLTSGNKMFPYQGLTVVKPDADPSTLNFETWNLGSYGVGLETSKKVVFPERIISNCNSSQDLAQSKIYFSGDFNGDGLTDVMALDPDIQEIICQPDPYGGPDQFIYSTNSTSQLYFVDLDRRKTTNFVNFAGILQDYFLSLDSRIEAFDANGDGKTDILHFKNGKVSVYSLNSNNQLEVLWQTPDPDIKINQPILPGDYNGDGKMDFLIATGSGSGAFNYVKFLSTGIGFEKIAQTYPVANIGYSEDRNGIYTCDLIPLDINGDGKTDIVQFKSVYTKSNSSGSIVIDVYKNSSGTFLSPSGLTYKTTPSADFKSYPIPIFLSPKISNQFLAVGAISNNKLYEFNLENDFMRQHLLRIITNGNQVQKRIQYSPLQQDQYEPFYTPTIFTETFPNIDIIAAPNIKIVTMLEEQSKGSYKKQLFNYSGAVINSDGIGFLGFRSTSKTNWHEKDEQIISTLSKNDIALRGANVENYTVLGRHNPLLPNSNAPIIETSIVKEKNYTVTATDNLVATQSIILKRDTWIKSGSTFSAKINEDGNFGTSINTPTDFITKSLLTYESELLSNKVFKIRSSKIKEFNNLESTNSETSISYDTYHNPIQSTTFLKESGRAVKTTVSDVNYYAPTVSPYIIGRASGKSKRITISGDVMTSEEQYVYDNSLLTQIKKKGNNTNYITEDNTYDTFGNITQKILSAAGSAPRKTNYIYDSSGRFVVKSTDVEGLSAAFTYNLNNGALLSETNPYGLKTVYEYDNWFKKIKTTDYLGKNKIYTYTRNLEKVVITATGDDGSVSEETFDDLGRKTKVGSKKLTGSFAYVDYQYDIYDRNYKVSEPYFGSTGSQWNEVKYDQYGRVSQNIAFNGKTTNINYSGLSTTVNDGSKSKVSVKNAIGNMISITDIPGGTINYTYFANGNLKESDYGGVKTTISQDGWGRKTKLTDTSAGDYTYECNELGEITKETTPNGTTTYTLNAEGKVTEKTISGTNTNSKTTYTYDSTSKLLLDSKFEDFSNGTNTITNSYTYDAYKRIVKTVETTSYASFTKELSYDAFGRIDTETSMATAGGKTSAKTIKNIYKNGSHWQIIDNDTSAVLWQANSVNARGQITSAQNGPTTITNTYDTYGFASQFKYDKTANSSNILTLNTVFDAKLGNLTSRTNSLMGTNESFKYDVQDRLTEFTNAQGVQEEQLYDDQGRITENKLGKYSYSKDKPYQNSGITITPEASTYYTARPAQSISYNVFKSPVEIEETGVDKISFEYNANNSRTAMFYGGLQTDKLQRSLRKYYSADGTMEVKQNMTTGVVEFVTYIGGDGYSAPIVIKSDGATQNYLYLQRDYQGSIVAIADQTGTVVEKRSFDAWGAIVKVQDGAGNVLTGLTILDRGYTGHEHLQSVGLINMNGRIYDPKLHRFLQPDNFVQDPYNTQNYNRYGYVLNNPLKFTDYSGEKFKLSFNDIFAGVEIIAGAALTIFTSGVGVAAGGALIASGVAHFAATYNEFKQTGDWGAASKNAGVFFNVSFKTDFGYGDSKDKQNGIVQNAPVINPKTTNNNDENRNSVSPLIGNSIFVGIGYGLNKLEGQADKVGDLRNFKIQNYYPGNKYEFVTTASGITDGKVYLDGTVSASNNLKYLKLAAQYAGYGASAYSLTMSFNDYSQNKIPGSILLWDIGMTGLSYVGPVGAGISAFYFIGVRNPTNHFNHQIDDFTELRRVQIDNTRVRN